MAPFRIKKPTEKALTGGRDGDFRAYLDRLIRMIPAEVIGLYLVGSGLIPADEVRPWLLIWAVVCLVGVFAIRIYGTSDPTDSKGPQWPTVIISAIAFVIWIYSLGGPFAVYGFHKPFLGSLAVLAWTFFVPIFYRGD